MRTVHRQTAHRTNCLQHTVLNKADRTVQKQMGADRIQGPAVNSILFLNKADRTVQERMGADHIQGPAVDSISTVFEQS